MACRLTLLPKTPSTRARTPLSALYSVFGASVVRRRREVASIESAVLVVREPRPQAGRHVCRLEVFGVSAAWRVLGLGVEPLLRQPLDDPQRIARPLVEVDDVVLVVARAVAYWRAVLERWVCFCAGAAADPGGSGTGRHMPGAPHKAARCTAFFRIFPGLLASETWPAAAQDAGE